MTGWFDNLAKGSAQRKDNVRVGRSAAVSRRRLIASGTAVAATAWTAPILMASSAAAVGLSACLSGETYCSNGNLLTARCCPAGSTCVPTGGIDGTPSCENEVGGICKNSGTGSCRVNSVHCNGNANTPKTCNYCDERPICGGEGAVCTTDSDCAQSPTTGFLQTCSSVNSTDGTTKFCRHRCVSSTGCASGQYCDSTGFCAAHCTADSDCMAPGTCQNPGTADSICLYSAQA